MYDFQATLVKNDGQYTVYAENVDGDVVGNPVAKVCCPGDHEPVSCRFELERISDKTYAKAVPICDPVVFVRVLVRFDRSNGKQIWRERKAKVR